jgi:heptosyltransferase-2
MSTSPSPRRMLIVKFGAIGDVVMAIPGAYAMHQAGYRVDWLCGVSIAPVLSLYPWIHVVPVDDGSLLRGGKLDRLRAIARLWRQLAGRRYDIIATLYYDARYRILTLPVRSLQRTTLSHTDRRFALIPGRHHTDEYARILAGRADGETPTSFAPILATGLPSNPVPRSPGKDRVVLVAGGARNALRDDALRRWPVESYAALAEGLLRQGYEVVLSGGPDDSWVVPFFAGLPVLDTIGRFSLLQTLALLESADLVITHDTGPLHLAGITSTAILTLFGPTDPHGRLPQRANCVALWGGEHFACRPCYDGRDYAPCSHNGCIREITPALALHYALRLLAAASDGRPLAPQVFTTHNPGLVKL